MNKNPKQNKTKTLHPASCSEDSLIQPDSQSYTREVFQSAAKFRKRILSGQFFPILGLSALTEQLSTGTL